MKDIIWGTTTSLSCLFMVNVTEIEPAVVITHKAVEVKESAEKLKTLWYFTMVPGWAVK